MHELCTLLVSNEKVTCALIVQHDWYIEEKSTEIQSEHIKKDKSVLALNLEDTSGQARLCYWPILVTVKEMCAELKAITQEQ